MIIELNWTKRFIIIIVYAKFICRSFCYSSLCSFSIVRANGCPRVRVFAVSVHMFTRSQLSSNCKLEFTYFIYCANVLLLESHSTLRLCPTCVHLPSFHSSASSRNSNSCVFVCHLVFCNNEPLGAFRMLNVHIHIQFIMTLMIQVELLEGAEEVCNNIW